MAKKEKQIDDRGEKLYQDSVLVANEAN
jgi:hypothetical protein